MRHEEAMERMLEADPDELVGESDTPLAAHVQKCERCNALGRRLLEEQTTLARAIEEIRPRAAATEATDRALGGRGTGSSRWGWGAVLVPLAAAAAVAALLLWTPREGSVRRAEPPIAVEPGPARVSIDVPEGGAVVFATRDPAVTLVWIERPEGERR